MGCFKHLQFNPQKPITLADEQNDDTKEDNKEDNEDEVVEGIEAEDFQQIQKTLNQLGVKFTQVDAYRLQKAVAELVTREERKDDKITLFGKIGPYWVIKAETSNVPEAVEEKEEDDQKEPVEETKEEEKEDDELIKLKEQVAEIQTQAQQKPDETGELKPDNAENLPNPEAKPDDDDKDDEPDMGKVEEKPAEPKVDDPPKDDD